MVLFFSITPYYAAGCGVYRDFRKRLGRDKTICNLLRNILVKIAGEKKYIRLRNPGSSLGRSRGVVPGKP